VGTGTQSDATLHDFAKARGPVTWPALGLVTVAAASAVAYYKIERERRLEQAMGKIVSSESDGWSPNPEFLAKRKWKLTEWGWFPAEDAFGGGKHSKNKNTKTKQKQQSKNSKNTAPFCTSESEIVATIVYSTVVRVDLICTVSLFFFFFKLFKSPLLLFHLHSRLPCSRKTRHWWTVVLG